MRLAVLALLAATASAYGAGAKTCESPTEGHGRMVTPVPTDLTITLTDAATGAASTTWTAGHTYTVVLAGTSTVFDGYLLAPLKGTATSFSSSQVSSALAWGSFATAESTSRICTGCKGSITHSSPDTRSSVTGTWTAPATAGAGSIYIWAMITVSKSSGINYQVKVLVPELAGSPPLPSPSAAAAAASPAAAAASPAAKPAGPAASPSRTGGALNAPAPSSAPKPPLAAAVGGAIGGGIALGVAISAVAIIVYRRQNATGKLTGGNGGGFAGGAQDARTSVLGNPLAAGAGAPAATLPRSSRSVFTPVNVRGAAEAEDDVVMNPYARAVNV